MDASAVADYLKQNPEFFEDYADVIAEIFVPHPHGGHAIPIAERQIVTLREKSGGPRGQVQGARRLRHRERPDQREGASLDARALRGARPRDHARGAVSQPEGGLRRAAGLGAAVGQGARSSRTCPSLRRRRPRSASTPTSSASRIAGRWPRSSRANGSRTATSCSRSRSCRCAPRRPSACSRSAAPIPTASTRAWARCTRRASPSSRASRPRGSCRRP